MHAYERECVIFVYIFFEKIPSHTAMRLGNDRLRCMLPLALDFIVYILFDRFELHALIEKKIVAHAH